jgi:hypothetical protein
MKAFSSRLFAATLLMALSVSTLNAAEDELSRQGTATGLAKRSELAKTPIRYTCRITKGIISDADSTASQLRMPTESKSMDCTATIHGTKARYESVRTDTGERLIEVCDGVTRWICRDPGNGQPPVEEQRGPEDSIAGRFHPWLRMVYHFGTLHDPSGTQYAAAGNSHLVEYTSVDPEHKGTFTMVVDKTKDFAVTKRVDDWSGRWTACEFGGFVSINGIWLPTHALFNYGGPPPHSTIVQAYDQTEFSVVSPEEAAREFVIPAAATVPPEPDATSR